MTEDFDNIFEEPAESHPPDPIADRLLNPIKELIMEVMAPFNAYGGLELKPREYRARTFVLGDIRTDPEINELFKAGWQIHLMQSFERQFLIIFSRDSKDPRG